MADQKLTALPLATAPTAADLLYVVQAGTSKQINFTSLMFGLGRICPSTTIGGLIGTVDPTDCLVYVDPPVAGTSLDLPSIAAVPDRVYSIRNRDTGGRLVTLVPDGADTIEGAASLVIYATESVCIHADAATNVWYVI